MLGGNLWVYIWSALGLLAVIAVAVVASRESKRQRSAVIPPSQEPLAVDDPADPFGADPLADMPAEPVEDNFDFEEEPAPRRRK